MDEKDYFTIDHFKKIRKYLKELPVLCEKWMELGRNLELEEPELEGINHDHNNLGQLECAIQTVRTWFESRREKPLLSEFIQALLDTDVGRNIILEIFPGKENFLRSPTTLFKTKAAESGGSLPSYTLTQEEEKTFFSTNELMLRIQGQQQSEYSELVLPSTLFEGKILYPDVFYIDLQMYVNAQHATEVGTEIQLKEIFEETENVNPTRILIEGNPGYGKTTLVHKLLRDWAKKEEYLWPRFILIFPILLRDYTGDLDRFLCDNLLNEEVVSNKEKLALLREYENQILLLLDGYDELGEESKLSLLPLLNRKEHTNMTVIVTSRPGQFRRPRISSLSLQVRKQEKQKVFWQKKIEVKGIAENNREIFLQNYFGENFGEVFKRLRKGLLKQVRELLECPLYLLLIALTLESQNADIKRKTDLYKMAINYLVKRNLVRHEVISVNDCLDVFSGYPRDIKYHDLLLKFGKLSLIMLKNDRLFLWENEICEHFDTKSEFFLLGLVVKKYAIKKYEEIASYEIVHKTFMEFSAAFYIATRSRNGHSCTEEIINLMNMNITPKNNEILYAFLCGLFPNSDFLINLVPWKFMFPVYKPPMSRLLLKLEEFSEDKISCLIPAYWVIEENNPFLKSGHLSKLLRKGTGRQGKTIRIFQWDAHCSFFLPRRIKFPTLIVKIKESSQTYFEDVIETLEKFQGREIYCDHLVCRFHTFHPSIVCSLLKIFKFIKPDNISVSIGDRVDFDCFFPCLLKYFLNDVWNGKVIEFFGADKINLGAIELFSLSQLIDLIKSRRISKGLGLKFCPFKGNKSNVAPTVMQTLISELGNSRLEELALTNNSSLELEFNASFLCRKWKSLLISGKNKFDLEDITLKSYIEKLGFHWGVTKSCINDHVKLILSTENLKHLECRLNLIKESVTVSREHSERVFDSVEKLHLILKQNCFQPEDLNCIIHFRGLNSLSIDLQDLRDELLIQKSLAPLQHVLSHSKISTLGIFRVDEVAISVISEFFKEILSQEYSVWINELRMWFACQTKDAVKECLSLIKELLEKGLIKMFCLTNLQGISFQEELVTCLYDVRKFSINRMVDEFRSEYVILDNRIVTETIQIRLF